MIKVNLSTVKKPMDLANVGGLDLSKINVKWVILAIIFLYIPDFFVVDRLTAIREERDQELQALIEQKNKITKEVNELKNFDKQIEMLKRREEELAAKLEVVKSILSTKKNPWNILVYVAKNIPPEIWLTEIQYQGDSLTIRGRSADYQSQGLFLENLKKSIFFDKNIVYQKGDAPATRDNRKLASFEMIATITRYE